jgi:outer membrane protein
VKPAAAFCTFLIASLAWNGPAAAQDEEAPRRTRVGIGAQLVPSYPGADSHNVIPLFDLSRTRGDEPFIFEAPDESFGFALFSEGDFSFGPALGLEGSRTAKDVGAPLDKVDTTIEAGAFVQYDFSHAFRGRLEARRGIGGHDGWTGSAGADYIVRDKDNYLVSIGPRVTWSNARYHRAYFGVTPAEAAKSGLAAYRPGGGVQAVGLATSFLTQLNRRWGIYSYAKYDRLIEDAARSPIVRNFGSRDQLSGGIALTYTFGKD